MDMMKILAGVPLFAELASKEIGELAKVACRRTLSKDSVVFLAHEVGSTLSVIVRGRVKVVVDSEDGKEAILSILKENDFFGELALLDEEPRSASVVTLEETELAILNRKDLIKVLRKNPNMSLTLLRELASRLRRADRQIESLALLDVFGRVAHTLLTLAADYGTKVDLGSRIDNRPTHLEIANMSGTTRETVSRVLAEMVRNGYIEMNAHSITVYNTRSFRETYLP
jgi:CRP/FNR family cyclic AMP-dependent transcriptional regulator